MKANIVKKIEKHLAKIHESARIIESLLPVDESNTPAKRKPKASARK